MSKHWKRTLALLGVVAATGLICAAVTLGAKKPPAPPPPPPINYSMTVLGTLSGDATSRAFDINNYGQVTGESDTDVTRILDQHAFRYTPGVGGLSGVMEDLGILGPPDSLWNDSTGNDVNDNGHVVGIASTGKIKGRVYHHAFIYTDHMIDLGTLGGIVSEARGINSDDDVVGNACDSNGADHGFLYTAEFGTLKLESLIVDLPADYQGPISAQKINDAGQICGQADGQAILLTPVTP